MNRREFLRDMMWFSAASAASGCVNSGRGLFDCTSGAPMQWYKAPPIKLVRVGIVGMGGRGQGAMRRLSSIPGVLVTAICDNNLTKLDESRKWLAEKKLPAAKEFLGDEAWKALCESDAVDVVYNTTPWDLHVPVGLAAMRGGKHVMIEVPSAFTVDECWELVETSEKYRRHCMQLENCNYGEIEMLTLNLVRQGFFGELVHAEGAYIHDLRRMCKETWPGHEYWRFDFNQKLKGNQYPTHGLVPLCIEMNINHGDRLDYLVSLESGQFNFKAYMDAIEAVPDYRRSASVAMGDMNSSLIRTVKGRSMLIQHDVSSPRPYSRIQFLSGTKGAICDYPYRIGFEEKPGAGLHKWFTAEKAEEIRQKYKHPMWKQAGEIARVRGGHGGMDYIMDLRWVDCLQRGLPLDTDVYDLAATCCLCELTEKSVLNRSRAYDIPDFTRGAWKTSRPLGIESLGAQVL
jgi:hypothetical protein